MVAWLGDWLHDIIAVIMLAVCTELLLPNKAMLRYTRLVIGLLVLLTLLSPLLRLLQGDITAGLSAGIQQWEMSTAQRQVKMPTLADIQRQAEDLKHKQQQQAANLTGSTLSKAMETAIVRYTGQTASSVEVKLKWIKEGDVEMVDMDTVTVTFPQMLPEEEAAPPRGSPTASDVNSTQDGQEGNRQIEAVEPVSVEVMVPEVAETGQYNSSGEQSDSDEQLWQPVNAELDKQTRAVLTEGWGLSPEAIIVRQPASIRGEK
ncbi:stage III sporulation protein AF [Paenibacillus algorifonticola]|uniref:Stage III sporulation protein AF n=1 Tax=Paenibacillus algorifonticola TaxID=684063 RepID=A0A1I2EKU5_9BACL|nr:stage III sporulation protein AF [Paenibacillus algorifonticola]SFE93237.1 stage III sporulation protein AF [Paenibacillus algorifonticola]